MSVLLQHRVKKLLANQSELTHAKSLLDSIPTLIPSEDAATTSSAALRQSLKGRLDQASVDVAEGVLREMEALLGLMDDLKKQADVMDRKCRHVLSFLDTTERTSNEFVAQAAALRTEQQAIQDELDSTKDFLQKYQVALVDMKLLEDAAPLAETHATDDALSSFFQLMHRLASIRTNCEALVAQTPASSSLELLDEVCKAQQAAFDKLYQWAIVQCNLVDESDMEAGGGGSPNRMLPQAIRFLHAKPEFYAYCKDTIAQSRRSSLLRRFVDALTRGGPNGIPRPIEIHAHDPVRYAGDMLAWVHQTAVGESDFFRVLFDGHDVPLLLGQACAGLARPLQIRLQQLLRGPTPIALLQLYPVLHVVAYYRGILSTMVTPDSDLSVALAESHALAKESFVMTWHTHLATYHGTLQGNVEFSLAVAHPTLDLAHKTGHLLDSYLDALLPDGVQDAEVATVLTPLVQTLLTPLTTSSSSLPTSETNVFTLNQLACVYATLSRYDVAKPWLDQLQVAMDASVATLAHAQTEMIVQRHGLTPMLATTPATMDPDQLRLHVHSFCTQLMALELPVLDRIGPPEWRNRAETQACEALCHVYDMVYAYATSHEYLAATVVHTPQEMRTILDI
ncbi:Aste57867_2212 [Aphanomyces stellatus]|uniref:Conserved oligomeric Golgi complex subunit 6 n=1 Tax=Aphanomyces stellatus TaxID=120398 RepID=A0A485KCP5_9STRA|nr:hypothetical protein As57867_002207 [Aphanomyces stellatus]VFT79415.1 Aste57867_2212 [Aphanomyces stellatus]